MRGRINETKFACFGKSGVSVGQCGEAFFILPFCFVTFILLAQNKSKNGVGIPKVNFIQLLKTFF
jgi:hypothetical protein